MKAAIKPLRTRSIILLTAMWEAVCLYGIVAVIPELHEHPTGQILITVAFLTALAYAAIRAVYELAGWDELEVLDSILMRRHWIAGHVVFRSTWKTATIANVDHWRESPGSAGIQFDIGSRNYRFVGAAEAMQVAQVAAALSRKIPGRAA